MRTINEKGENVRELLIDGVAGIYAYNELVSRYTVYTYRDIPKEYEKLEDTLKREALNNPEEKPREIDTIFNPDNDEFIENIEDFTNNLYVSIEGTFYSIESENGDIFATHPDADYEEETDSYFFEKEFDEIL